MKKIVILLSLIIAIFLVGFLGNNRQLSSIFGTKVFAMDKEAGGLEVDARKPEIFIKAINPGYTIDGKSNVGEMIEIARTDSSDILISLAGIKIDYTNSSGTTTTLVEFPEHSFMAGETILLRLASSPERGLANLNYAKTLAFKAGPLEIKRGDEVLDRVCWDGKEGCYSEFKSISPTILMREGAFLDFKSVGTYEYEPVFKEENYFVEREVSDEGYGGASQCLGLTFSEILSFYDNSQAEQFIEFYNSGAEQILLDGCQIKYKNKYYPLTGIIRPEEYFVRFLEDFNLTKNPTTTNVLELVDTNGSVIDKLEYPNGQRKGTSYAFVGYDEKGEEIWRVTYAVTPGEANNYQEFKTCEVGKVINEATGNCVKVTSVAEKVCEEGQYLNLLTGRCKKIETATIKTCKEGYELNPETNRCRKIKENTGAIYALKSENYTEESSFVAIYAVLGVALAGILYLIYEFRREIGKLFGKVFRRFR